MTALNLPRLRELLQAGTPRPWSVEMSNETEPRVIGVFGPTRQEDYGCGPEPHRDRIIETDYGHYEPDRPDADLIVSAVNALPHLLDRLELLESILSSPILDVALGSLLSDVPPYDRPSADHNAAEQLRAAIDAARKAT